MGSLAFNPGGWGWFGDHGVYLFVQHDTIFNGVWNFTKPSGFIASAEGCIIFLKGADMHGVPPDLPREGEGGGGYFKAL